MMTAALLLVLIGVGGLAIDLGMVYNRKAELHSLSKTVALAAARELNGTDTGVNNALLRAAEAAGRLKYQYGLPITWSNSAVTFSNSPDANAEWVSADTARTTPAGRFYARVDTSELDLEVGRVDTVLIRILSDALASATVTDRAVAGRASVNVLPLAICAMSANPGAPRTNPGPPVTVELVEYGFRRGVSYNLMQLNPGGTTPANFVIDPHTPPGGPGSPSNTDNASVGPYICAGRMQVPRVTGGAIRVTSPFPIDSLYLQLNSRFDQFSDDLCHPNGAPPDFNIKSFAYNAVNGTPWMSPVPTVQSALASKDGDRLQTIADLSAPPAGTPPALYGPLWTYARAVKYSSYVSGKPEPSQGYTKFATADWPSLYSTVPSPTASGYSATKQPYEATSGTNYDDPSSANLAISILKRRVLHVPLLACPVASGDNVAATALAIGKFFMTVPATPTSIYAEFAGIVPDSQLTGQVILYP
jgi:Flp pilus assembly protein TadG